MKLLTNTYANQQNHVIAKCDYCGQYASGIPADPTVIRCGCGPTKFDKLPIYYLIHNNPQMVIFSLKNKLTGKELIGVTNTGDKNKYKPHIRDEIDNIQRNNIYPELVADIEKHGMKMYKYEALAFASTLSEGAVKEKLYINVRNTMQPNGYNTCYVLETLLKPVD